MRPYFICLFFVIFFVKSELLAQVPCGVSDTKLSADVMHAMQNAATWANDKKLRKSGLEPFYTLRLGVDIDSQTYNHFDRDSVFIQSELIKILDNASRVLEADANIRVVLSHLNIHKNPATDPNQNHGAYPRLFNLMSRWPEERLKQNSIDIIVHLSIHPFDDAAGVAVSLPGQYCVAPWGSVPTILHELGHSLGSPHTHSCYWPGGPIEICVASEGSCHYGQLLSLEIPGTIMGYCTSIQNFHPLSAAIIEDHARNTLLQVSNRPGKPLLYDKNFDSDRPYMLFLPVLSAEKYEWEFAEDLSFDKIYWSGENRENRVPQDKLQTGRSYFLRVKSINRFGESDWSEPLAVHINAGANRPPALGEPYSDEDKLELSDVYVIVPFENADPSNKYEVEVFGSDNNKLIDPKVKWELLPGTNSFGFEPRVMGIYNNFSLRVRSIKDGVYSPWSDVVYRRFTKTTGIFYSLFSDLNNMPSDFPVNNNEYRPSGKSVYTLFEKKGNQLTPIHSDEFKNSTSHYTFPSQLLTNLKPSTNYSVLHEHSTILGMNSDILLKEKITKSVFDFKTGSENKDFKYSFVGSFNTPGLGTNLVKPKFFEGNLISFHELGTSIHSLKDKSFKLFNRINTNGKIADLGVANSINQEKGHYYQINRAHYGYSTWGGYSIGKYDLKNNLEFIEQQLFFLPNDDFPAWINKTGEFVMGHSGLYKIENNQSLKLWSGTSTFMKITETKRFIWFGYYNANDLRIVKFNKHDLQVAELGSFFDYAVGIDELPIFLDKNRRYLNKNLEAISYEVYNGIQMDKWGFNYLMQENSNSVRFFKYKNDVLINQVELPRVQNFYKDDFEIDDYGNIWYDKYQNYYIKVNICDSIPEPKSITQHIKDTGFELIANGCENTVWRWESKDGVRMEEMKEGNRLETHETDVNFYVKCFKDGCSGFEKKIFLTKSPEIVSHSLENKNVCSFDSVTVKLESKGVFEETNQFDIQIFSEDNVLAKRIPLESFGSEFRFFLDLPAGKYSSLVTSSFPESVSDNRFFFEVFELPKIAITQKSLIDKVELSIPEISGVKYEWLEDGRLLPNETSHKLITEKPLTYRSKISDNTCSRYSDEFTVELALGKEDSEMDIILFGNPNFTGLYKIEVKNATYPDLKITLTDLKGAVLSIREISSFSILKEVELDLRNYAAGTYNVIFENGLSKKTKRIVKL